MVINKQKHSVAALIQRLFFTIWTLLICVFSSSSIALSVEVIIPKPTMSTKIEGEFHLQESTRILVDKSNPDLEQTINIFSQQITPATGFNFKVERVDVDYIPSTNYILFKVDPTQNYGDEGYTVEITSKNINVIAKTTEGAFRATQSIRQMLGYKIEAQSTQNVQWKITNGHIIDYPRYQYRGFMLDVARYFYSVEEIKEYIDLMALYKYNTFHFHLTDDQGWRIEIPSWPKLTIIGSNSAVGKETCENCFYSIEEFKDIVAYADARYIQVIPELDTPGHVKSALASYPEELYCDGDKPDWPYTDVKVKVSSLCFDKPDIYRFFNDIVSTLAPLINSDYIHVGGDETPEWVDINDYKIFMRKARDIIATNGKTMVGWTNDLGEVDDLGSSVIGQHWSHGKDCCGETLNMVKQGSSIIMSPAKHSYISLKHDKTSPFGGTFAGYNTTKNAYQWDPDRQVIGVDKSNVLGVEAALWGEWGKSKEEGHFLAFPRFLSLSEVAWSQQSSRQWDEFKYRLGEHGPRLDLLGINFYQSPLVPWRTP